MLDAKNSSVDSENSRYEAAWDTLDSQGNGLDSVQYHREGRALSLFHLSRSRSDPAEWLEASRQVYLPEAFGPEDGHGEALDRGIFGLHSTHRIPKTPAMD